jgi:8-oxo-dGTP pyrophosphatase MutT (NUDIX family)
MLLTNLVFLIRGDEILLAMKKRRFGAGKMNGVGGKVMPGEDMMTCLKREVEEEISVKVNSDDLEKVAIMHFSFQNKPEWEQECHVFFTKKWEGEPTESEEMKPEWIKQSEIPYDRMWEDDKHWLPRALKGEKIRARWVFTENGGLTSDYEVNTVQSLD